MAKKKKKFLGRIERVKNMKKILYLGNNGIKLFLFVSFELMTRRKKERPREIKFTIFHSKNSSSLIVKLNNVSKLPLNMTFLQG